jgi:NIPSNAP
MIVEMRTYLLKPRSIPAVEERFGKALKERVKFSKFGAFWHSEVGTLNQVIHVWPYDNLAHRESARAAASKAEGWPPNINEYILEQRTEILNLAPFSPPVGEERALGNIYEIRRYTTLPGSIPTIIKRWSEKIEGRTKISPVAGVWYSEIGPLNQWIHIWPYRDFAHREAVRKEAASKGVWPPDTHEFLVRQENSLVMPASFSPLH